MNANLKRNVRTGIAVFIAAAGAVMCGNAIAQQVNQDNSKRVSGTVVRVRETLINSAWRSSLTRPRAL
ncbi:hypothetical protein [Burkholderia cenocepacia]|uniref:hypothetical protein n=1 Tax=Burkholderia cenocepacia TaxID=95486 RepID=UPI0015C2CEEB|nr:hypothetical protein [Burkholderia cenocepacia]